MRAKKASIRIGCWLLLIGFVASPGSLGAAENVVWRIGVFDESSREFRNEGIDYSEPSEDPVFRVGTSREEEDWQAFQPGPANALAGGREHPFTILFDLPEEPKGLFRFKIAVLYETQRLSFLRVNLNGHRGIFYFEPRLNYSAGDWQGTFVPQTSMDTRIIDLPAKWFRRGKNRLVLTALDDPPDPEMALGAIVTGHSGLIYDALELTHASEAGYDPDRIRASAQPTIFYRQGEKGLTEVVEITVEFARLPKEGTIQFRLGEYTETRDFTGQRDFGQKRFEFEVPEWTGPQEAQIVVQSANGRRSFDDELRPKKKWTLFLVPHQHLDIGFTDYVARVAELQSQVVDDAMELLETHDKFRYTLDGFWIAEQYLVGRTDERRKKFLQLLREEKLSLPAQYASQHTGTASLEGLVRSLYPSHFFAKQHSIPVRHTHITDVPSYSWSYASVLHAAAQKYFLAASNNWRAPILLLGRWNENSPFYWEGPDGGRVLMWYSRAYLQLHTLFGLPPRTTAARDSLPVFLQAYSSPTYRADAAIIFGSQLENTPLESAQATFPARWSELYAWPRLVFSTFGEALGEIERQWVGEIPTVRGDFGPYWEDGFGSDAFHVAIHRENQRRILTAEKLGTLATVLQPGVTLDEEVLGRAWENILLYDEHTWTAYRTVTQPQHEQTQGQLEVKRARVKEARRQIDHTMRRGFAQLEAQIGFNERTLLVFNSLNWKRTGFVTHDIPTETDIVDLATGEAVPCEVVYKGQGTPLRNFGGPYQRVRFPAREVPPLGYKAYALRPAQEKKAKPGSSPSEPAEETMIESPYYRVVLDPMAGAIRSIWDKELGREIVDQESPYRFGAYLYVTGGDDLPDNSLYRYGSSFDPPKLTVHPATEGRLISLRETPFGRTAVIESSAVNTPQIRTEVRLYEKEKKIAITYELKKKHVLSKEAAYFAFPVDVEEPQFSYATQNSWVNPARDELRGGSREWYAVHYWAAIHDDEVTAAVFPLDAPLVNFGDIVRGRWPEEFNADTGTVFSWVMNNYWQTNFAAGQGGKFRFRYVVTTQKDYSPSELTRKGWSAMTPFEVSEIVPTGKRTQKLPEGQASLLEIDQPNVVLVTWKLAEDGRGSILRLVETAGERTRLRLSSRWLDFDRVWRCTALEENLAEVSLRDETLEIEIEPFQILTLRVETRPSDLLQ